MAGFESPRFGGGKSVTVAGLIDEVKKRGPRVILTLDDRTGRIEAMLFEETYQKHRDLIAKDALVLVEGLLRFDEFSDAWRLAARRITRARQGARAGGAAARAQAARTASCRALLRSAGDDSRAVAPGPVPDHGRVHAARGASGALTLGGGVDRARRAASCSSSSRRLIGRDSVQVIYGAPAGRARRLIRRRPLS